MKRTSNLNMFRLCILLISIGLLSNTGCEPTSDHSGRTSQRPTTNTGGDKPTPAPSGDDDTPSDASSRGEATSELSSIDLKSKVGEDVAFSGKFVVVDTYDLARRGQVKIARQRLYVPTSYIDPNDADPQGNAFEGGSNVGSITKAQKLNDTCTITLDDGSSKQNVFPPKLFPGLGTEYPTVRVGSVVDGIEGKVQKEQNRIVLVPSKPLNWTPAARPDVPEVGDSTVKVASFNVLNFFTSIDNGSNGARGADTTAELKRQQDKIVSAILEMDAGIYGLMEMENNLEAETQLVAALNEKLGEEVFRGTGLPKGFATAPGGENAIRVGFIYRTDRVSAEGDIQMIQDPAFALARTPLVQRFSPIGSDQSFMVIVNHFKSKGGSDRADKANKNQGDGQGAYNATRREQSLAICNYLGSLKTDGQLPPALVIGDLNAYQQEDPIDAMRARGMVDLKSKFANQTDANYSFIYYGQSGSLDHVIATPSMAEKVTGVAIWHINADEPRFLDYNQEYNPKSLFQPDPYRSSDHDPLLIGIRE